ncbi:MAG TPA: alpha-glucosidase/alpha-galactosidase [Clostridiales bacterium]|jgi:alpha-galactosidase|nr:alpha-glucosidase/alpha-galactosidase [Clostridiales bacterium]
MPRKFAFIGAGSFGFTRSLVRDILSFPAFADAEIALMDIHAERLAEIKKAVQRIVDAGNYPATVTATMDRAEALKGADGVITTILHGEVDVWQHDILIPKKYGVDTNVGDTRGPSGIFRFLRTINPIMDIAADIDRYCPDAVYLNYTNPMAMLCRTVQGAFPKMKATGLCHSVQGTAHMLARWIGAPDDEISYTCAGINHQAFYTEFLWNGKDAYPLIHKAITEREDVYNEEIVRNEMYLALGYYVTESSGHNSEYNAWFRKRPDLIEKYCLHGTGWNPGEYAYILNEYRKRETTWRDGIEEWFQKPVDLKRGNEYAASIFNATLGDGTLFKFNGNVRNFGLIDNLPYGSCVEVPVLASPRGLESIHVGAMPPQLAILSGLSAQIEEMVVEGSLNGDREMIYRAICYDPLTSAVLSLREIRDMVDEMFEKNKDWMPQFK